LQTVIVSVEDTLFIQKVLPGLNRGISIAHHKGSEIGNDS